jgi:transcriptional regulator with XRE-family HTH domain
MGVSCSCDNVSQMIHNGNQCSICDTIMSDIKITKGGAVYPNVLRALAALGDSIALARRTRRISADEFAKQMGVSRATLHRLENGDPGCSLNTLASAMHALGRLDLLADLISERKDDVGMMVRREDVPKRAPRRSIPRIVQGPTTPTDEEPASDDEDPSPYSGW